MKIKNETAELYLSSLREISSKCIGKLGYAVARNMRNLEISLKEYFLKRDDLIMKYGEGEREKIVLKADSLNFPKYKEEIKEYSEIEHNIDIMTINANEIYKSQLTATEISSIMFMIEEEKENG